jgi:double zinc ribbon protein
MELIRDIIEWIASDSATTVITLGPYLLVGLVGLYVLWLVVGYLRVSQVGLGDGHAPRQVLELPSGTDAAEHPRGVPYCAFDGLQYPADARFCTRCERDLSYDCVTCGATLRAGEASCYRCGTRTGAAETSSLT